MAALDIKTAHHRPRFNVFIAFYSRPISNDVMMRTAPAQEGPWSSPARAFIAKAPDDSEVSYSAVAHKELSNGTSEFITYHRGTTPFASEIRVVEVRLDRAN